MAFSFDYSVHKYDCRLKIVSHWDKHDNKVLYAEIKNTSGLKIASNRDRGSNVYMQASLREKAEHWQINTVIL